MCPSRSCREPSRSLATGFAVPLHLAHRLRDPRALATLLASMARASKQCPRAERVLPEPLRPAPAVTASTSGSYCSRVVHVVSATRERLSAVLIGIDDAGDAQIP